MHQRQVESIAFALAALLYGGEPTPGLMMNLHDMIDRGRIADGMTFGEIAIRYCTWMIEQMASSAGATSTTEDA